LVIFFVALKVNGALALYWTVSNLFMLGQELWIRRQMKQPVTTVKVIS
jgi:membrane protein insertase Oxa1/YidC/SpoIIIJ